MTAPEVRTLSLWEPWASALVDPEGPKTIETRGYSTTFRGPLVILAAQHRLTRAEVRDLEPEVREFYEDRLAADRLHHGNAVGAILLERCFPTSAVVWHEAFFNRANPDPTVRAWWPDRVDDEETGTLFVHPQERPWGGYGEGRYAWCPTSRAEFPFPVRWRGHQGAPRVAPDHLADAARAILRLEETAS